MLSRAAERVYWAGRYLERAENTARIIQQYSQLLLDLPSEAGVEWSAVARIVGGNAKATSGTKSNSEKAVLQYLIAEPSPSCSLLWSVTMARENIRNTRDLLPIESWENVNELYRYARENLDRASSSTDRFDVLDHCIGRVQHINGTLSTTMSHRSPYHFLTIGKSIERADMTSRIIDVAAAYIRHNESLVKRFGSTLWTNVLKSVSGFQMYRQYRQPQVIGVEVIDFLVCDRDFPRAIQFCIDQACTSAKALPDAQAAIDAISAAGNLLKPDWKDDASAEVISGLMDTLQKRLGVAHQVIGDSWFLRDNR